MNDNNEKLRKKDYFDLIVEGGIGAIPYIGGVVQSLYFGSKNEKRFRRVEKFYENLNEDLECIRDQIPEDVFNLENKDQLIGIFEGINDEIEKSKAQNKIEMYRNLYKNCLLRINNTSWDSEEYFLLVLNQLTSIEIQLLAYLMNRGNENFLGNISMVGYSQELIDGSLNRLADFGLLEKTIGSIVLGEIGKQNMGYKISNLGIQFISSTLT
ncbi:hypothetical protein [Enterococcus sp. 2201sp1_2201st1_B8_2201SCRN_220225]|uniref:hypothetical protein n=1 Tax=unclassified Enterococcus TaxID=2608891 RepID=UPI0034A5BA33